MKIPFLFVALFFIQLVYFFLLALIIFCVFSFQTLVHKRTSGVQKPRFHRIIIWISPRLKQNRSLPAVDNCSSPEMLPYKLWLTPVTVGYGESWSVHGHPRTNLIRNKNHSQSIDSLSCSLLDYGRRIPHDALHFVWNVSARVTTVVCSFPLFFLLEDVNKN